MEQNTEIRVAEYVNELGQRRYSPILPDGQRPYLGYDDTYWSLTPRSMSDDVVLWRFRSFALRAARRQWKWTLASRWWRVS